MVGVVLTESAKIQPMGWVLIIGFAVILVIAVFTDKKNSAKFNEEVTKRFEGKKVYGNDVVFITSDNELIIRYASMGISGYKLFKLADIKYIMSCWDGGARDWYIGFYNDKKKLIAGEDHKSSKKKPLKTKASFHDSSENVEFLEMITKFTTGVQLVGVSFKEYKGSLKIM